MSVSCRLNMLASVSSCCLASCCRACRTWTVSSSFSSIVSTRLVKVSSSFSSIVYIRFIKVSSSFSSIIYIWFLEITSVETVSHTIWAFACFGSAEVTSVIPTASSIFVPTMSSAIYGPEMWTTKIEVVSMWIACVNTEMPITSIPV